MNRIVRDHYPASRPSKGAEVSVTVEVRGRVPFGPDPERKPMTPDELRESIRRYKAQNRNPVTAEEAVARMRALRDEWDHR